MTVKSIMKRSTMVDRHLGYKAELHYKSNMYNMKLRIYMILALCTAVTFFLPILTA